MSKLVLTGLLQVYRNNCYIFIVQAIFAGHSTTAEFSGRAEIVYNSSKAINDVPALTGTIKFAEKN